MIVCFCQQFKFTNFNTKAKSIHEVIVDVEDNGDQMFHHWNKSGLEEVKVKAQTSKGFCFLSSTKEK